MRHLRECTARARYMVHPVWPTEADIAFHARQMQAWEEGNTDVWPFDTPPPMAFGQCKTERPEPICSCGTLFINWIDA
jgi:hypothetical protein